jgi:hypothetical protein
LVVAIAEWSNKSGANKNVDIFICYRRESGETTSKLIQDQLSRKGCRVFLDVEVMLSGKHEESLLNAIDSCKDFIAVLSKNGMDCCLNEDERMRKEIAYALKKEKNIIPIMLPGFDWPKELPSDIFEFKCKKGIQLKMMNFDATLNFISKNFLKSKPHKFI